MAERHSAGRFLLMPVRARQAFGYYTPKIGQILRWVVRSREYTNYTYEYTDRSLLYLSHLLAIVTRQPVDRVEAWLREPSEDAQLSADVIARRNGAGFPGVSDPTCYFGKRLAWYAIVRATRPCLIVETGVGFGLTAVLLSYALAQNAADGYPGEYIGIDIDPDAGFLLSGRYRQYGRLICADSLSALAALDRPVDFFISDSHVSGEHEYAEYSAVRPHLATTAILTTSLSQSLPQFARDTGRRFACFKEEPKNHWFPGAWIGFAFPGSTHP